MIYILTDVFRIGDAATNRIVAYANAMKSQGLSVAIVALASSPVSIPNLVNTVSVNFLCGKQISNPLIRLLYSLIRLFKFIKSVDEKDKFIVYNSMNYLPFILFWKKKYIYHERTEYPEWDRLIYPRKMYYYCCTKCTGMFVISTKLENFFVTKGVRRISIINMVVDPSRFSYLKTRVSIQKQITYCGSLGNSKDGVDLLLQAFAEYHKEFPDRVLSLIGPITYNSTYSRLLEIIEKEQLNDAVKIWGLVPNEHIPQILCDSEMLILARPDNIQAEYGFPTKLGEYLLSKRPVVLTPVGDIPLFFKNMENALLVLPNDIEDLKNAMVYISKHPDLAISIGKNGYSTALAYFDCNKEVLKIKQLINETITD